MTTPATEVAPTTGPPAPQPGSAPTDPAAPPAARSYTEEEFLAALEKARKDESNKVYGKIEDQAKELARLREAEEARQAAEDAARKEAAESRKRAEEADLDARALLEKRSSEWQAQLDELRKQNEAQRILFEKESQLVELERYRSEQLAAHIDEIDPRFHKHIRGTTKEEIDAAIHTAIQDTAMIMAEIQQAQVAQRAAAPTVSTASGNPGVEQVAGQGSGQRQWTAEELAALPPGSPEHLAARAAHGIGNRGRGQGLFG